MIFGHLVLTRPPPPLRFGRGKAQNVLTTQWLPEESGQAIHADVRLYNATNDTKIASLKKSCHEKFSYDFNLRITTCPILIFL